VTAPVLQTLTAIISTEFPDWQVTPLVTMGRWEAFWRSGDGRHRHIIIASTAAELLGLLREIRGEA